MFMFIPNKSYATVSQVQIIDESPAEFPTVSICDSNPFTTFTSQLLLDQMMQELTYNKRAYLGINTGLDLSQLGFFNFYLRNTNDLLSWDVYEYAMSFMFDPKFSDTQRKSLGWDMSEFVIKCKFNGIDCDKDDDFKWYFSFQYGNCYHFNPVALNNQVN